MTVSENLKNLSGEDLRPHYPERIVCLTEESTETLYLLGEQERIVGISGFTVRPREARRDKPKVSAFISAKTDNDYGCGVRRYFFALMYMFRVERYLDLSLLNVIHFEIMSTFVE